MKTIIIFIAMSFMFTAQAMDHWEASDVSVLLPLPRTLVDMHFMLSPQTVGTAGSLIPENIILQLPTLVLKKSNISVFDKELKVVAIRIDPCFQEGFVPRECRRQIRFVWQPVIQKKSKYVTTDAAVHTFYDLTEQQWREFLADYGALIKNKPSSHVDSSLGIHPLIKKQGLQGAYWKSLSALILSKIGGAQLTKITLMSLEASEDNWAFTGFNIEKGQLKLIVIPKLGSATTQSIMMAISDSEEFVGSVFPSSFAEIGLWFFDSSIGAKKKFKESDLLSWSQSALELENPNKHNSGTTDCVSCHISESVVLWHLRNFPQWTWPELLNQEGFEGARNADERLKTPVKSNQLRAFGYQGATARFSQRLQRETQNVLDSLK